VTEFQSEIANIVFDSDVDRVFGTRAAVIADARRQFVWSSSRADLALTMWTDRLARDAISVDGQVLPHGGGSLDYTVELRIEGIAVASTETDLEGCFRFEGLDRGDYGFCLRSHDHEIVAGPIEVLDQV
jgi:hypothetical protein